MTNLRHFFCVSRRWASRGFLFGALLTGVMQPSAVIAQYFVRQQTPSNFYIKATDARPDADAIFLVHYVPEQNIEYGSRLRIVFDNRFQMAANVTPKDAELSIGGDEWELMTAADDAHAGFSKRSDGIEFALPWMRSVSSGKEVFMKVGKNNTIRLPSQVGAYGIALQIIDRYGRITGSRATKILVSQPIGVSTKTPAPPSPSSAQPRPAALLSTSFAPSGITTAPDTQSGYSAPPQLAQRMRCDMDNDQSVGWSDVYLMNAYWNGFPNPQIDCYLDGKIDLKDAGLMMTYWNTILPPTARLPFSLQPPSEKEDVSFSVMLAEKPPVSGFAVSDRFVAYVMMTTGQRAIGAATVVLRYPSTLLAVRNVTNDPSIFSVWFEKPMASSASVVAGTGGIPGGFRGGNALVYSVTFEVMAPGQADVSIDASTRATYADKSATYADVVNNGMILLLAGTPSLSATSTPALPSATSTKAFPSTSVPEVKIISKTHPDPTKWYGQRDAEILFDAKAESESFLYRVEPFPLDKKPHPNTKIQNSKLTLRSLTDGVWRLFARRVWGERVSSEKSFFLQIDGTQPERFQPELRRMNERDGSSKWYAVFSSSDAGSGMAWYEVEENGSKNIQTGNAYLLSDQKSGWHSLKIRAVDRAGNARETILNGYIPATAGAPTPWIIKQVIRLIPAAALSQLITPINIASRGVTAAVHGATNALTSVAAFFKRLIY